MNVITVDPADNVSLAKERKVMDNHGARDCLPLRFHKPGYAIGRNKLAHIVRKKTNQIFQKSHIPNPVAHNHILQQDGMVNIRLVFPRLLFFKPYPHQARQTAKLQEFCQRLIPVFQLMKQQKIMTIC